MIGKKFCAPIIFVLLLVGSAALLGGCGKKEKPPEPSSPISQAPAPPPNAGAPAGMASGKPVTIADAEAAMKKSDCFTCHAVDKKLVGPAYSWVAFRYKDDKDAVAKLSAKVKNGGAGNWSAYTGGVAMTPHPQLSDAEIKAMVQWVLSQPPVQAPPKV